MPSSEPLPPSDHDRSEVDRGGAEELTFEQELAAVEQSLHSLKERYTQVEQDQQEQAQLHQRRDRLQAELEQAKQPELKAELKQIQSRLDELEFNLESRLFSWSSLKEPFWQIVRFGGLGMVLGWFLAFAVLKQPQPSSAPLPPASSSQQP
jgi:predicted RNase H-like nuclease (RuvC/YqgF family)